MHCAFSSKFFNGLKRFFNAIENMLFVNGIEIFSVALKMFHSRKFGSAQCKPRCADCYKIQKNKPSKMQKDGKPDIGANGIVQFAPRL